MSPKSIWITTVDILTRCFSYIHMECNVKYHLLACQAWSDAKTVWYIRIVSLEDCFVETAIGTEWARGALDLPYLTIYTIMTACGSRGTISAPPSFFNFTEHYWWVNISKTCVIDSIYSILQPSLNLDEYYLSLWMGKPYTLTEVTLFNSLQSYYSCTWWQL